MRLATVVLTIVLSLGLSGCWFGKKKTAIPPPPAPQPKKLAPPEVKPQPQPSEQKPLPMPPQPETTEPAQITLPAPKKTPPPKPPAKKRAAPAPQPPQPAEQPPVQPAPPPAAPPQLGAILSDAERRQYEAEYARSLSRARAALQQASAKSLSRTQRETVERIKTFIQQAEESKGRDLTTALELVRRADVLGQDLLKEFP
jgi:hypothetical protein